MAPFRTNRGTASEAVLRQFFSPSSGMDVSIFVAVEQGEIQTVIQTI